MLEINLIPPELRKKKKKSSLPANLQIPMEVVIGSGGGLILLLIVAHLFLLFTNLGKLAEHNVLKGQWEGMSSSKTEVDTVVQELRLLQSKIKMVETISGTDKIQWSQKLNILSDQLTRGTWIREITLTDEVLFIEGSSISKDTEPMLNVHNFTAALKQQQDFLSGLKDLELESITRKSVKKIEMADFVITSNLEPKK